ncbi:RNA polymerase Rpc34 [Stipitochalara longipes BDJ]|nr:RNA polymerase Rpc34 [Stipitochalara longipes BDJ]
MASNSPSRAEIAAWKEEIYEACSPLAQESPRMIFRQSDILDMDIIPNDHLETLLAVAQLLLDEKLFKAVHDTQGMGWKLRTVDEAKKYRSLSVEQEAVYSLIDEAGDEGIWSKTIKAKTNLHDSTFTSCIKHLSSKSMISEMKSVEHPTRKMYIKSSLSPSDRATGGPWYTDGELDEEFINQAMTVLFAYVSKRTFYRSKTVIREAHRSPKKVVTKMSPEQVRALRNEGLGPRGIEAGQVDERTAKRLAYESMLPMPAGYQGYPGLDELTLFVENGKFFSQTLTANDIQTLLDIMCFDDRIERVIAGSDGIAYKALRKSLLDEDERSSVLTEAPCGRCPVFDLCEEGGPVGPSNCEYFSDWLSM